MVSEILIGHNINKSSSDYGLIVVYVKKKTVTTLIRLTKGRTLFFFFLFIGSVCPGLWKPVTICLIYVLQK